jgi:hypothetical protein
MSLFGFFPRSKLMLQLTNRDYFNDAILWFGSQVLADLIGSSENPLFGCLLISRFVSIIKIVTVCQPRVLNSYWLGLNLFKYWLILKMGSKVKPSKSLDQTIIFTSLAWSRQTQAKLGLAKTRAITKKARKTVLRSVPSRFRLKELLQLRQTNFFKAWC